MERSGNMKLGLWYTSFLHDFQRWHYRMTPKGRERADACTLISLLQTLNLSALRLWVPQAHLSRWVFALLFAACFFALCFLNRRMFEHLRVPATYAAWTDRVPSLKEFPGVYAYLLFTIAMFVVPALVAIGPSA